MTIALMKTKAEQALLDSFAVVAERLPGGTEVAALRRAAIGRFADAGLPHRRIEAWKYTDLRSRLNEALPPAVPGPRSVDAAALVSALGGGLAELDCHRLLIVDGVAQPASATPEVEQGWHLGTLAAMIGAPGHARPRAGIERALSVELADDRIVDLNAAFATDGAVLQVEAGSKVQTPIHILHVTTGALPLRVATRNLVRVEAGAEVVIVESHIGLGLVARQATTVMQIEVGSGARVTHVKLVAEGASAQHLGSLFVEVGAGASYRAFQMTEGSGLMRNSIQLHIVGSDSKIDVSGIMLGRGSAHMDTTLVVDHAVPRCESRELFKCVLDDQSRAVFQGKIVVRQDAQKTDGKMMAQALMLSSDAEFDSKPELEISADDVVCGHGSTVAEIDPDLVFYCRSRGIPPSEARALLIGSFVGEAFDRIEHEAVRSALAARAEAWLAALPATA